jgi:hypothetical protein
MLMWQQRICWLLQHDVHLRHSPQHVMEQVPWKGEIPKLAGVGGEQFSLSLLCLAHMMVT